MIAIRDWRDLPAAALAPLFEDERRRWAVDLRWDTAGAHAQIEQARTTWGLPGRVSIGASGRLDGLVYFFDAGHRLEIGGIIAGTAAVTTALLGAVLDHAAALNNPPIFCFASSHAPGLAGALDRHGFEVDPFIYFERPLTATDDAMPVSNAAPGLAAARSWRADDLDATAALLQRAYEPEEGGWFAPGHTIEAWRTYLRNLVDYAACGAIDAAASRCLPLGDGLGAVTLVTTISDATAHVVQVAVDPDWRGAGLAAGLVRDSCTAAGRRGKTAITLMVAARNAPARALYDRLGFAPRATFVAATLGNATRRYPVRLTSAAPAGGGDTTRR